MSWVIIFDLVRHIFELFFYLVTGPLVAVFAFKKIREVQNQKAHFLELQRKILELSQNHNYTTNRRIVSKETPERGSEHLIGSKEE